MARLPFTFYCQPFLTVKLKNYDAVDYFQRMVAIFDFTASHQMLWKRWRMSRNAIIAAANYIQTLDLRLEIAEMSEMMAHLHSDAQMQAFHAGETDALPAFYAHVYRKRLGPYADLMPVEESAPILRGEPAVA